MNQITHLPCPSCRQPVAYDRPEAFLRTLRAGATMQAFLFLHQPTATRPKTICIVQPDSQMGQAFVASVAAVVERN